MADGCPNDNSTAAVACLLRVISKNTNPSYDFDPLNFAFTAAIGVLALVIACITVFQGLLAAGPGRLKASASAIGTFHIHSRSRIDRTELAVRTTARVPLITFDVLFHRIVRQKYRPNVGGEVKTDLGESGMIRTQANRETTATWLNLLSVLGLDDPEEFPLIRRSTDYLPNDVQAAPAAAELRCLAILAVLADAEAVIQRQDRFLKVVGGHSQLTFRDHPSLGLVAAYEAYEETAILQMGDGPPLEFGTKSQTLDFEDLDRGLQLASGRLAYANARIPPSLDGQTDERGFLTLIQDLVTRTGGCQHDICLHSMEDWTRAIEYRGIKRKKVKGSISSFYVAVSLLVAERANMCRGFPKERLRLSESLDNILELSDFWREEWTATQFDDLRDLIYSTFWNEANVPVNDVVSATWVVNFEDSRSTIRNASVPGTRRYHLFKFDSVMYILQGVRSWLQYRNERSVTPAEDDRYEMPTLSTIIMFLATLDNFLLLKCNKLPACTTLKWIYHFGTLQDFLHGPRRRETEHDAPGDTKIDLEHQVTPDQSNEKRIINGRPSFHRVPARVMTTEDMHTLLIFRAILMAMLLDSGADTSILYASDFRDSIVRVL